MASLHPDAWTSERVKDIALKISSGVTPDGGAAGYLDAGIPLLRSQNIHFDGLNLDDVAFIDAETHASMKGSQLKPKDILINITGASIGRCTFVPVDFGEGNVNQHVCFIRGNHQINFRFLAAFLSSPIGQGSVLSTFTGASRQGLSHKDLGLICIPLPPLSEQIRIAAYLDASCAAVDAAVNAKKKQLDALTALRKTLTLRSFTKCKKPNIQLKDSGIESIGMIPEHWQVKQIRYACQVNYGITLQLEKGQTQGDGVRILTVSNVSIDGKLDLEDEYYIDPALLVRDDYLQKEDLLFNWRNGSQYHVGKTAHFDLDGEFTHVSFLLRIRCSRHLDSKFMSNYLGVLKDAGFFSGSKDKVNKTFNSTELKRLRVIIPTLDEQREICREIEEHTRKITELKNSIESQIATLIDYRKSLIHECVTGQRRISEADVAKVERTLEQAAGLPQQ